MIFDRGVILMLVWSSFSDAVAGGLWRDNGPLLLAETIVGVARSHTGRILGEFLAARRAP